MTKLEFKSTNEAVEYCQKMKDEPLIIEGLKRRWQDLIIEYNLLSKKDDKNIQRLFNLAFSSQFIREGLESIGIKINQQEETYENSNK